MDTYTIIHRLQVYLYSMIVLCQLNDNYNIAQCKDVIVFSSCNYNKYEYTVGNQEVDNYTTSRYRRICLSTLRVLYTLPKH